MTGENLLIVIGIDKYKLEKNQLDNAVFDALRFKKVLEERYGYSVVLNPILDNEATRKKIKQAFLEAEEKSFSEDNLIIYYAGHGYQNEVSKKGAWIPHDGEDDRTEWISHSDIFSHIENIKAKHILLISDSCYSGTFISREREYIPPTTIEELEKKDSRWVFVSGGEQPVKDGQPGKGSPFGAAVYEFLTENELPAVNAEKLFDQVRVAVQARVPAQKPAANFIPCPSNKGGQLIFRLSSKAAAQKLKELQDTFSTLIPYPVDIDYQPRTVLAYSSSMRQSGASTSDSTPQHLEDILETERKIVLLGSPGSGKSIELLRLGVKLGQAGSSYVPIHKRLNGYAGQSLREFLPEGWTDINHESAVIILDGLDEIPAKQYSTAVREISLLAKQNPLLRIIISCRANYYELPEGSFTGTLEGFNVYYLNDLSLAAVGNYIENKLGIKGRKFLDDAFTHSFLDIVQKPFFLEILVKHYEIDQRFSLNRKLIMEEHLLRLMRDRKMEPIGDPINERGVFSSLEQIAFIMEMMGVNNLTNEEFEKVIAGTGFSTTLRKLPFLNYNVGDDKWQFDHNNIQEYLASRIISRSTFEEIIRAITIPNTNRIKPSWANTISFFISIASEETYTPILNWLLENDIEYVVKFEPERISTEVRIQVVKQIFNFYTSQGINIRSNKFTTKDLMRFGESIEILNFLIAILEDDKESRLARINALHLLDDFSLVRFSQQHLKIMHVLTTLLKDASQGPYFTYATFNALAALPMHNDKNLEAVVKQFGSNINEYIRAGLYRVIISAGAVDKYLDTFIEGLNVNFIKEPTGQRGNVHLMDESFLLHEGLKELKTAAGTQKLLTFFSDPDQRRLFYHSDFKEVFESLILTALHLYEQDKSIYYAVLKTYLTAGKISDDVMAKIAARFFEQSDTRWNAFKEVWTTTSIPTYEKASLISKLVDQKTLNSFKASYGTGNYSEDDLLSFYEILRWSNKDIDNGQYLVSYWEDFMESMQLSHLLKPGSPDWGAIYKQREQKSFDLLFDLDNMKREIVSIFEMLDQDSITTDQLYELRVQSHNKNQDLEEVFILSAIEVLRDLDMVGESLERPFVLEWLDSQDYYFYRGIEIYKILKRNTDITLSSAQESFIIQWTQSQSTTLNTKHFLNNDNTLLMVIWYYLNRFDVLLSKDALLFFTEYYNFETQFNIINPGTIEQLEEHLPKKELLMRVRKNIAATNLPALSWLNNASYAIRHDMNDVEEFIFQHLVNVVDQEYLYGELLQFWFDKYKKTGPLIKFIQGAPVTHLKHTALRILVKSGMEQVFLNEYFEKLFHEEAALDTKIFAANQLMYLGQLNGLLFAAELLSKYPKEKRYSDNIFHNINKMRDVRSVPILLQLLLQTESDLAESRSGFFRSYLLDTIFNIGWQSELNFQEVKILLSKFILEQGGIEGPFSFLNSIILKMEEQLIGQLAQGHSLDAAIKQFDTLGKS